MSITNHLSVADLIAAARAATGLEDFGEPSLSPVLDRMVQAINEEGRLSERGAAGRSQHR